MTQPPEHDEQAAHFELIAYKRNQNPEWGMIFAIPNGGDRHPAVGAKMKAEGVQRGVPDIFLASPRGHHHGLFIEMKVHPNKPTPAQRGWLTNLSARGYKSVVCYGAEDAIAEIERYLSQGRRAVEVDE